MPLEQIRPLLSLETKHQGDGQIDADGIGGTIGGRSASPTSPRTPIDGEGLSSAASTSKVGPSSPTVRSNKNLFGSPYEYPRQMMDSADLSSPSSSSFASLQRSGKAEGMARSGSWCNSGISIIGRGRSASAWETESGSQDTSFDTAIQSPELGLDSSDEKYPRPRQHSTASKGSLTESQNSYTAGAASLKSHSKRSSISSSLASPEAVHSSLAPLRQSSFQEDEPLTSRPKRSGSSSTSLKSPSLHSRSDSFSGPGIGRVMSIGRGSASSYHSEAASSLRRMSRASVTVDDEETLQAAPVSNDPRHRSKSTPAGDEDGRGRCRPVSVGAPTEQKIDSLSRTSAESPTPRQSAPLENKLVSSSAFAQQSPFHRNVSPLSAAISEPLLSASPSPSMSNVGEPQSSQPFSPHWSQPSLSSHSSPQAHRPFASSAALLASPASDRSTSSYPITDVDPVVYPTRRHTAGYLRTRSALSQQTSSIVAAATAGTPKGPVTAGRCFYAGGQGGRKAARARARHPSLAMLDNAPFSVLEARRSEGMRQAAASFVPSQKTTILSFPEQAEESSASLNDTEMPERPLSPIARASPDAPRPMMSLGTALSAGNLAPPFALKAHGSAEQLDTASVSSGPLSPTPPPADDRASPGLISAASAAAAAVQQIKGASPGPSTTRTAGPGRTTPKPSRPSLARQHSRPHLASIDIPTFTSSTSRYDASSVDLSNVSSAASSPNSVSSPGRPPMSRASTLSNLINGSPQTQRSPTVGGSSAGASQVLGVPASVMTHVLRTPTTEEWARFLASQGVDASQHMTRTRSTTGRSLAGFAAQQRTGSTNASTEGLLAGSELGDSALTAERLRGLHLASRSVPSVGAAGLGIATDLSDVSADLEVDTEDEDEDILQRHWGARSRRSRSSSSSSHSSEGRMEALHAAISMPPSRRGTPPPSDFDETAHRSPSLLSSRFNGDGQGQHYHNQNSAIGLTGVSYPANGLPTGLGSSLSYEAQRLHGYVPAPPGRKRSIDDFRVVRDIGRGAYGLVKLVQLKDGDNNIETDPEFVVKYIIKSRILADCWRRHRVLGPIPVEIHVMDQLRRLPYVRPAQEPPWSPTRIWPHTPNHLDDDRLTAGGHSASSSTPSTPATTRRPSLTPLDAEYETRNEKSDSTAKVPILEIHPALCTMLDFFEDESFYYLVMPRFGHGTDLFDYIESRPYGLQTTEARCILGQVADGVRFLHEHNIVHRDIKDENVILDGSGRAQLIDFGSAAHVRPGRSFDTFSGTLDYAAAEILRGDKYAGKEQDVWALGVVAYICLVGDAPFWNGEEAMRGLEPGSRAMIALEARCSATPSLEQMAQASSVDEDGEDTQLSEEEQQDLLRHREDDLLGQSDGGGRLGDAKDLIERCLELSVANRPSAADVCRHVFLAGQSPSSWSGHRGWLKAKHDVAEQNHAA